jgi:hypothetical protein
MSIFLLVVLGILAMMVLVPLAVIVIIGSRIVTRQLAPYQPGLSLEQKQAAQRNALAGWIGIALGSLMILRGRRR